MTKEEFIKKLVWFEDMMQAYHRGTYGNYGKNIYGSNRYHFSLMEIIDSFTRRKYTPIYKQLLLDLKEINPPLELNEYQALINRITSAYEF